MSPNQDEIQLPATQEQEMRAMQNLFQRAANTIVEASNLGKEVQALKEQLKGLLADTDRMREHITWLEQENATLRTQRDEAQNTLSDTQNRVDRMLTDIHLMEGKMSSTEARLTNAQGEAKLWQEEATKLETERNGLVAERNYLKGMLENVWHGIKDHFTPKQEAPKTEEVQAQQSWKDPSDEHHVEGYNSGDEHPKPYHDTARGHEDHQRF